jgi:uncharacterized protein (TIGR00661 family)
MDWGLGHATRCIPVIRELISRKCEVGLATNGDALKLLHLEFPELVWYELPGYNPHYSSGSLLRTILFQVPKFLKTIRQEHRDVDGIVKRDGWDIIISDNRYGCWSAEAINIMITHQMTIPAPRLWRGLVNRINRKYFRKFSACWIPDLPGDDSLAGDMVKATGLNIRHIGLLSRFKKTLNGAYRYDFLAIISGPEPQRSIFEEKARRALTESGKKGFIVRGVPGDTNRSNTEAGHLMAEELNQLIIDSGIILSRSGYSTIMDLAVLGKKAVFIPTPGQPEQEYLAKKLAKDRIAFCMDQNQFNLQRALAESVSFSGFKPMDSNTLLSDALDDLLA